MSDACETGYCIFQASLIFQRIEDFQTLLAVKDLNSTLAKRGSVFIGLMTPDGAIWFRYQRAVLMR